MKREILFRGKRIDNGEWIYGGVSVFNGSTDMFDSESVDNGCYEITPETVGQFIGLIDKNGVKIFEGDILSTETLKEMKVSWNNRFSSFSLTHEKWIFSHWFGESCDPENCTIVGNIHES